MVYEYVAIEQKEVDGVWTEIIIAEGKVIAYTYDNTPGSGRDKALLKIGALLGEKLTDHVEVKIRPF